MFVPDQVLADKAVRPLCGVATERVTVPVSEEMRVAISVDTRLSQTLVSAKGKMISLRTNVRVASVLKL